MADCPLIRFDKIDDKFWRCERPDDAAIAWLIAEGAAAVVNLEWEESDPVASGIIECRLPDWEPLPSMPLVGTWIEDRHIRAVVADASAGPWPRVYHCHSGQNRTGVAIAAIRIIIRNDPIDFVITDMKSFGGIWANADEAYIRSLADRRNEFLP